MSQADELKSFPEMSDDRNLPMPDEIYAMRSPCTRNEDGTSNPDFLWLAYEQAEEGYPPYTRYVRADRVSTPHPDTAAQHVSNPDELAAVKPDDLTISYMLGFEKGREGVKAAVEALRNIACYNSTEGLTAKDTLRAIGKLVDGK